MSKPVLFGIATALLAAIAVVGWFISTTLLGPELEPAPVVEEVLEPEPEPEPFAQNSVIGTSVEGRDIEVYQFGTGDVDLLFVGGIHGGYEWNSSLLSWQMIDWFTSNPAAVPERITVHIIPALNPDGLALVTGTGGRFTRSDVPDPSTRVAEGRFNANRVDLNRNFDCNWAPESTWRGAPVSAGTAPFSEPEAAALQAYVEATQPAAVAFWHSQANNVYGSACNAGVLPLTSTLGADYAAAADYGWVELFDAYPITGDAEGWLATLGIPAVTVEKESFSETEWERNWAGMQSWFAYFVDNTVPAR
jgi:hypothetical protein